MGSLRPLLSQDLQVREAADALRNILAAVGQLEAQLCTRLGSEAPSTSPFAPPTSAGAADAPTVLESMIDEAAVAVPRRGPMFSRSQSLYLPAPRNRAAAARRLGDGQ